MILRILLVTLLGMVCHFTKAQSPVNVNPLNGAAEISIPIWQLKDHDLSTGVTLVYQSHGIRVKQASGVVGLGWGLSAGGSITREVRDLPDDTFPITENGEANETRQGWLAHQTAADVDNMISGLNVNTDLADCSGESLLHATLAQNFLNAGKDAEPDIFHFSLPGYSGSFLFDKHGNIQVMPHQRLQIDYQFDPIFGITSFTITTPEGTVFSFDRASRVRKQSILPDTTGGGTAGASGQEQQVKYFYREYAHYQEPKSYNSQWHLTQMTSPSTGAHFTFSYRSNTRTWEKPHEVIVRRTNGLLSKQSEFSTEYTLQEQLLTDIHGSNQTHISLYYTGSGYQTNLKSVLVFDRHDDAQQTYVHNRQFDLGYVNLSTSQLNLVNYHRNFLASITEMAGCEIRNPYEFQYWGVDLENKATLLPDPHPNSANEDLWGYYTTHGDVSTFGAPQLYVKPDEPNFLRYHTRDIPGYTGNKLLIAGSQRSTSAEVIMMATLDKVKMPAGGSITLNYEAHEYRDPITEETVKGGGIRVKRVRTSDGVNPENDIMETYQYDAQGATTGKVAYLPQFVIPSGSYKDPNTQEHATAHLLFTTTSAQNAWDKLIVRSEDNLAPQGMISGSNVGYTQVTRSIRGAGSTVYTHELPGMHGELSHNANEWSPATGYILRDGMLGACQETLAGTVITGAFTYPYLPFPNFGYARGLIQSMAHYNEAGQKVQETIYTYQDLAPVANREEIQGLYYQWDPLGVGDLGNIIMVPYQLHAEIRKELHTITEKLYDPTQFSRSIENVQTFTYGSPHHTFLTGVSNQFADGSEKSATMRYPEDYSINRSGSADANAAGLVALLNHHMVGLPLETFTWNRSLETNTHQLTKAAYQQYQTRLIRGQERPVATQSYQLATAVPLSQFSGAAVGQAGSTQQIVLPAEYEPTYQSISFTNTGKVATQYEPTSQTYSAMHWGFNDRLPIANIRFGQADEVAFSDFETTTEHTWQATQPEKYVTTATAHSGRSSYHFTPIYIGQAPALEAILAHRGGSTFILSGYIKTDRTSAAALTLTTPQGSGEFHAQSIPVPNTHDEWQYWETEISLPQWPPNMPYYKVNLTGLQGYLDNLVWHPKQVNFSFRTHDESLGTVAVSSGNGITDFYDKDDLGRTIRIRDQYRNIIKSYQYQDVNQAQVPTANFEVIGGTAKAETPTRLRIVDPCWENATYTWAIGNAPPVTTALPEHLHTFGSAGNYTVRVTVNHPLYTNLEAYESTVAVKAENLSVAICAHGPTSVALCGGVVNSVLASSSCGPWGTFDGNATNVTRYKASIVSSGSCTAHAYTFHWQIKTNSDWETYKIAVGDEASAAAKVAVSIPESYQIRVLVESLDSESCQRAGTASPLTYSTVTTAGYCQ